MNQEILCKIDELENLAVIVLGSQNSGKSHTWHTMFGRKVKTGPKLRELNLRGECVDVFLINGSPEERKIDVENIIPEVFLINGSPEERGLYVGEIIPVSNPRIVLCSVQDSYEAKKTFKYFADKGYFMFIHWLNPGYNQDKKSDKDVAIVQSLLKCLPSNSFDYSEKDGNSDPNSRVNEMKDFIYGWAKRKKIL